MRIRMRIILIMMLIIKLIQVTGVDVRVIKRHGRLLLLC